MPRWLLALGLAALSAGLVWAEPVPEGRGDLVVQITGFRNDVGEVVVKLYRLDTDSQATSPHRTWVKARATILQGRSQVVFQNLLYGDYAVSALHDEERNEDLRPNLLGKPTRGYGASNQASGYPPDMQAAKIRHASPRTEISINLNYH